MKAARDEAQNVFRQFAWNLAGEARDAEAASPSTGGGEAMREPIPIDAEGRFAGYASAFGLVDESGDVVMPGAFAKSLARRGRAGVRMLFQHDPKEPVGVWEAIREDSFGLWVEGRLVPGVPRADALRRLIERRAVDGLSIGFRTVRATREGKGGHRKLWQIDLWEISIVTFPMLDRARISAGGAGLAAAVDAAISLIKQ